MREIEREAFFEGMQMERELRWALRKVDPNIGFIKVMAVLGAIASLGLIAAVIQDPQGWPILFLAALFGTLPLIAPASIRQERRDAVKAKAIIQKWLDRTEELKPREGPPLDYDAVRERCR